MQQNAKAAIPHFYLYGDEQSDLDLDTLQVEPIRERSLRHDWIIHPHAHPDHVQVLYVREGGGRFEIEGEEFVATQNCLVVQPAGTVHSIRFEQGTEGIVATVATSYVQSIARDDPRLIDISRIAGVYSLAGEQAQRVDFAFEQLVVEARWTEPGRRTAIRAHFLNILVELLRLHSTQNLETPSHRDRDFELVQRYRQLMEGAFRKEKRLTYYAKEMGVSVQRLNGACKTRAGKTASDTLYERIVIEAKRNLLYTEMSVAEVGHALGYDDPAYFNRFFAQRVGLSPGQFRAQWEATKRVTEG